MIFCFSQQRVFLTNKSNHWLNQRLCKSFLLFINGNYSIWNLTWIFAILKINFKQTNEVIFIKYELWIYFSFEMICIIMFLYRFEIVHVQKFFQIRSHIKKIKNRKHRIVYKFNNLNWWLLLLLHNFSMPMLIFPLFCFFLFIKTWKLNKRTAINFMTELCIY